MYGDWEIEKDIKNKDYMKAIAKCLFNLQSKAK